jgi:hypothetical protein
MLILQLSSYRATITWFPFSCLYPASQPCHQQTAVAVQTDTQHSKGRSEIIKFSYQNSFPQGVFVKTSAQNPALFLRIMINYLRQMAFTERI